MPTMQQVHLDQALSEFGYGVLQDSSEHVAGGCDGRHSPARYSGAHRHFFR